MPLLFWQSNWNMSPMSPLNLFTTSFQSQVKVLWIYFWDCAGLIYCMLSVSECTHSKSLHDVTLLFVTVIMFSETGDDIEAAVNLGLIITHKKHWNKTTKRKQLYPPSVALLFLSQQVESFLWEPTSRCRDVYPFGTDNETSIWAEELVAEM